MFNILCEQPETVAAFLVPRIRTVVARNEAQRYIRYLTVWSALTRFITAPLRAQRFFDADGGLTHLCVPRQSLQGHVQPLVITHVLMNMGNFAALFGL